jgi:hypothetical protein
MKLPGAEHATVDDAKVRDYMLSPEHPVGRFKAVFFGSLGYTRNQWQRLQQDLLELGRSGTAQQGQKSPFGQKYEVRGISAIRDRVPWGGTMTFKELDTVVLDRDVPEHGLRRGDLGAVVQVYAPDGLEVEFVTASGRTQALITLKLVDVRAVSDEDLISVRTLKRGAA